MKEPNVEGYQKAFDKINIKVKVVGEDLATLKLWSGVDLQFRCNMEILNLNKISTL